MTTITIGIPTYNSEKTIGETIESALSQEYPNKEILVCDNCSTDKTVEIAKRYGVRVMANENNLGIGGNLKKLMDEAHGKYIVYLCSDDLFTGPKVVSDIMVQFHANSALGVIGRYYYQFMNGYSGAVMVVRDKNIITQSCNPSGMAFRRYPIISTNRIFIEMPFIVVQYLNKFQWTMLEYDAIAARLHPGGNTATKKSYYIESPTRNWFDLTGEFIPFYQGFIQLKNRSPNLLLSEIWLSVKLRKGILLDWMFWFYVITALIVPGCILRPLSNFYRHRITRRFVKIIERENENIHNRK